VWSLQVVGLAGVALPEVRIGEEFGMQRRNVERHAPQWRARLAEASRQLLEHVAAGVDPPALAQQPGKNSMACQLRHRGGILSRGSPRRHQFGAILAVVTTYWTGLSAGAGLS